MGHTVMLGLSMGIEAFYQRHWWVVFALIASCFAIGRRQARMRATKRSECRPITHCKRFGRWLRCSGRCLPDMRLLAYCSSIA